MSEDHKALPWLVYNPKDATGSSFFQAPRFTGVLPGTATLQISQLSMVVKQVRSGQVVEVRGKMPVVITLKDESYLTTTLFVKYNYNEDASGHNILKSIIVAAVPNGMLQDRYNPTPDNTIWIAGRNAPSLGEEFRVRLSFSRLKQKARWRVQMVPMPPQPSWWDS